MATKIQLIFLILIIMRIQKYQSPADAEGRRFDKAWKVE